VLVVVGLPSGLVNRAVLDCAGADEQPRGNLLIRQAVTRHPRDLPLRRRESMIAQILEQRCLAHPLHRKPPTPG
jgi:hypothetical protein